MSKVEQGKHLMYEEMLEAANLIFDEQTDSKDIADFLVALSRKGETAHEVAALASVMKSHAFNCPFLKVSTWITVEQAATV